MRGSRLRSFSRNTLSVWEKCSPACCCVAWCWARLPWQLHPKLSAPFLSIRHVLLHHLSNLSARSIFSFAPPLFETVPRPFQCLLSLPVLFSSSGSRPPPAHATMWTSAMASIAAAFYRLQSRSSILHSTLLGPRWAPRALPLETHPFWIEPAVSQAF